MSEKPNLPHGRDKEPETEDPMELVTNWVPGGDLEVMATSLIEEYARFGAGEEEILELFRRPVYQTHALYVEWGESGLRELIRKVLARTGQMRVSVRMLHHTGGGDA